MLSMERKTYKPYRLPRRKKADPRTWVGLAAASDSRNSSVQVTFLMRSLGTQNRTDIYSDANED